MSKKVIIKRATPIVKVDTIDDLDFTKLKDGVEYQVGDVKGLTKLSGLSRFILGFGSKSPVAKELFNKIITLHPCCESVNCCGEEGYLQYFRSTTDNLKLSDYVKNVRNDKWTYGYWGETAREKHARFKFDISDRVYLDIRADGNFEVFVDDKKINECYHICTKLFSVGLPRFMEDCESFGIMTGMVPVFGSL